MSDSLSDAQLLALERLSAGADSGPWRAMVEGRDHTSGDSFIQIGEGADRPPDMYVTRDGAPSAPEDLDLIAAARTALPDLIAEVRRLREQLER